MPSSISRGLVKRENFMWFEFGDFIVEIDAEENEPAIILESKARIELFKQFKWERECAERLRNI